MAETKAAQSRPALVLLGVLHILGGLLGVGLRFFVGGGLDFWAAGAQSLGYSPAFVIGSMVLSSLLLISSGVGLVAGKELGWWLAGLHHVLGVLRRVQALGIGPALGGALLGRTAFWLAVNLGVLLFLFREGTLVCFGIARVERARRLLLTIAVAVVVFALGTAAHWVLL